jgi:hypothetical protein
MMKALTEMMEAASTNYVVFTLACDTPADGLAPGVACLYLFDQFMCVVERLMGQVSIEFHDFLVGKRCKERLCIIGLDLSQQQAIRGEAWKMCKCSVDGHKKAPLAPYYNIFDRFLSYADGVAYDVGARKSLPGGRARQ